MLEIIFMLLVAAVPLLHLYTLFTEAGHLNKRQPWQVVVMLVAGIIASILLLRYSAV